MSLRLALATALIGIGAQASAAVELFPPDVVAAGGYWKFPEKLGEPALWHAEGNRRYTQRIRLFIGGFTLNSRSIRIDERNGQRIGFLTEYDGKRIVTQQRFTVRDADFSELQKLIDEARLWSIYPQFFVLPPDRICLA